MDALAIGLDKTESAVNSAAKRDLHFSKPLEQFLAASKGPDPGSSAAGLWMIGNWVSCEGLLRVYQGNRDGWRDVWIGYCARKLFLLTLLLRYRHRHRLGIRNIRYNQSGIDWSLLVLEGMALNDLDLRTSPQDPYPMVVDSGLATPAFDEPLDYLARAMWDVNCMGGSGEPWTQSDFFEIYRLAFEAITNQQFNEGLLKAADFRDAHSNSALVRDEDKLYGYAIEPYNIFPVELIVLWDRAARTGLRPGDLSHLGLRNEIVDRPMMQRSDLPDWLRVADRTYYELQKQVST